MQEHKKNKKKKVMQELTFYEKCEIEYSADLSTLPLFFPLTCP